MDTEHVALEEGSGHADVAGEFEELAGSGVAGRFVTVSAANVDLVVRIFVVVVVAGAAAAVATPTHSFLHLWLYCVNCKL